MSSNPNFIGGWASAVDPTSGRTYYFNANNQTTWEKPDTMIEAEKALKKNDSGNLLRASEAPMKKISPKTSIRDSSPENLLKVNDTQIRKISPKNSVNQDESGKKISDPSLANLENVIRSSVAGSSRESVAAEQNSDALRNSAAPEPSKGAAMKGIKLPTYGISSLPAKPLNKVTPQVKESKEKEKEKEEPVKLTPSAIKALNNKNLGGVKSQLSPYASPTSSPPPERVDFEKASQVQVVKPSPPIPSEKPKLPSRENTFQPPVPEEKKPKILLPHSGNSSSNSVLVETKKEKPEIQNPSVQSEWTKLIDPNSGKVYYANTRTGVTSWDPPAAYLEQQESEDTFDVDAQFEAQRVVIQSKPLRESVSSKALPVGFLPRSGKDEFGDIYDEIFDSVRLFYQIISLNPCYIVFWKILLLQ
jgi:hypothetical protein